MANTGTYTAEDLARLVGLSLRTVRYYVQKGLIAPPNGRGPGAHFDENHFAQLQRVQLLQRAGFDLESIRDRGVDLLPLLQHLYTDGLKEMEAMSPQLRDKLREMLKKKQTRKIDDASPPPPFSRKSCGKERRIPMADGVDLVVRDGLEIPSPKDLVEIALLIREIFGEPDQ